MKFKRNQGANRVLTAAGAVALLAVAGCKSRDNSSVKDVHAEGLSGSGKSSIALEFYPIQNGQIQMERCVTESSTRKRECDTFCTDQNSLRSELTSKVSNPGAVVAAIMAPGNKDFDNEFKALQSTLLGMVDNKKATVCSQQRPFHPPQGVTKQTSPARRNSGMEVADSYTLMPDGDFFRDVNGIKCQITSKVDDFKVSGHPNDAAVAYFVKGGDLWVVNPSAEPAVGNCPKTVAKVITQNVAKSGSNYDYWVTSSTNTTVVNSVRDSNGRFIAWDNIKPVYFSDRIVDVDMNQCFGVQGKGFSSYVAFLLTRNNTVIKIKGHPSDKDFSKEDTGSFTSLDQFRAKNNVCK